MTSMLRRTPLVLAAPFILCFGIVSSAGCSAATDGTGDDESVEVLGSSFEEFERATYREPESGIYIVNGDTPIDDIRELREFYQTHVQTTALIVHKKAGGADAKWTDAQKVNLTYCVSNTFNGNKAAAVAAMTASAGAWEAVANVNFVHLTAQDANCTASNANVVFDVRPVNSGGQYLARAFFPDSARASRNVLIDNTAFGSINPWTLAGIMRHELGHTLGFRHEHTRPESGTCFEDNNWRALTAYDSKSVMHYPQCNGTQTGDLIITALDTQGAQALYGAPGGQPPPPPPPPPPGGCAHDKCAVGAKLTSGCDPCVTQICAADAYCCNNSWDSQCVGEVASICGATCGAPPPPASCTHSKCTVGAKLVSGCDPCVTQICAADAYCCNSSWDSVCVGEVASVCGISPCQ